MNDCTWVLEKVDEEGTIELGAFWKKEDAVKNLMMRLSLTKRPRLKRIYDGHYSYEWNQKLYVNDTRYLRTRKVLFYITRYKL